MAEGADHKHLTQTAPSKSGETGGDNLKISLRNQRESPLLRLPAELRNKIWNYALSAKEIHVTSSTCWKARIQVLYRAADRSPHSWSPKYAFTLTKVCRQIYAETKILPFTLNEVIGCPDNLLDALSSNMFNHDQVHAITTVRIVDCEILVNSHNHLLATRGAPLEKLLHVLQEIEGLKTVVLEFSGAAWFIPKKDLELEVKRTFAQLNEKCSVVFKLM